jgi:hypothetical protein
MPSSEHVRPVIAFDGANFLVAWDENRRGERQSDIVGRLITRDGRRAGSEFVISDSSSLQHEVALAFDGTNYLVIWSDDRNRRFDMTGVRGFSIYGRMITPTGQLVGRELSVATGIYNHTLPAVTYNQSTYLVAWQRTPMEGCGSAIMGQIILTSGVLASSNFQISQSRSCAQTLRQPSTTPDDDQFLVVWGTDRGYAERVVYGQIVNSSGELMGSNFRVSHSGLHHLIPPDGVEEEGTAVRSLHF